MRGLLSRPPYFRCIALLLVVWSSIPNPVTASDGVRTATIRKSGNSGWHLVNVSQDSITSRIGVIYPNIGEPYRSIFDNIVGGIKDIVGDDVLSYAIDKKVNTPDLEAELGNRKIDVLIALGRSGLGVASSLKIQPRIVAGGVIWAPQDNADTLSVVSLAPAPSLLFTRLKKLTPSVNRVYVVYNPQQNQWLIDIAQKAAKDNKLTLVALQAENLKIAVNRYKKVLQEIDPKHDAIWLPQDSTTVNHSSILPLVLEQAWKRSIPLFSSSVVHVKRGALFSLYPDNRALGHQLGVIAKEILSNAETNKGIVYPLKKVLTAVNIRTANHLGIDLNYRDQQAFDLVFPRP